ncbi:MAG: ABC transporter ATP-binding protein [Candidatus Pacearchaeota archaeon]
MIHKENLISLKNVSKYYFMSNEIIKAIDNISIEIKKGDFIAIVGPSGSGKSTLMHIIGSLDKLSKGDIYIDNYNVSILNDDELASLRGKKIGFIFQQFNLIHNLTAKENVMLPMIFQKIKKEEREKKSLELLKIVGLEGRENHYPNQLSGGEQQRVAIARALANDPEIILADEPTGNLDTKRGILVMDFLKKLNEQGKTIILVTHDIELAKKYVNKIYYIKDGKIENVVKNK